LEQLSIWRFFYKYPKDSNIEDLIQDSSLKSIQITNSKYYFLIAFNNFSLTISSFSLYGFKLNVEVIITSFNRNEVFSTHTQKNYRTFS